MRVRTPPQEPNLPDAKLIRAEPKFAARRRGTRRWLVPFLIASALVHMAALLVLLFSPSGSDLSLDEGKAASPTEMAFELQPAPETVMPAPSAPDASGEPPSQPPSQEAPPQLTPPAPPTQQAPPTPPEPEPAPPPAPSATLEPPPPPAAAVDSPPPRPPPRPAAPPAPAPKQQAAPRPPANGDFFIPQTPRPGQRAQGARRGPLDLSIGPTETYAGAPPQRNRNDNNSDIQVNGAEVGSDYLTALHGWWVEHRRYPQQAIERGESGTVIIRFNINRLGRTSGAQIVSHSGSQWLDMQAIATFSNARLPPLPTNMVGDGTTLTLTINYQLIH